MHAACNQDIAWSGTDFNADHVQIAKRLSRNLRMHNLEMCNQSIAEFCGRAEIGMIDAVAITGAWSWLPENDQLVIVDYLPRGR
jgi:hypothetical protein